MSIYSDYLSTAEIERWIADTDIAWDSIDPAAALAQPEILDRLHDSALIESFFPIFTPRALEVLWDDVDATAVFSIQLYESYKHFHVFNRYLHAVGYRPVTDEEIVETRRRNLGLHYDDGTKLLTRYMMSEHFAAYSFFKDARRAGEAVLAAMLTLVAKDEMRHAQFAFDVLERRLARAPEDREKVLAAARDFRHIGLEVVTEVPVSEPNDFSAVLAVDGKLVRLTGEGLASLGGRAAS